MQLVTVYTGCPEKRRALIFPLLAELAHLLEGQLQARRERGGDGVIPPGPRFF